MRALAVLFAAALGAVRAAPAQVPELPLFGERWTEVSYPKVLWTERDGFFVGLYYGQIRPMSYDDYDDPERYHAAVSVDAQITSSGRKDLELAVRLPKLVPGWRFQTILTGFRHPRDPYFGLGNSTEYARDSARGERYRFYDADRRALQVRGEVQRRIAAGLRVLGGIHVESRRIVTPPGPSVLAQDQAAGLVPTGGLRETDAAWRFGLVFDTRDDEVAPSSGVKLELIHGVADSNLLGDLSYTRTTAFAAGFVPLGDATVLAARVLGQRMGGSPSVGSYYLIEASDDPYEGLGGQDSHRALQDNRFLGRHKLLGSLDVRHHVVNVETLLAVTLVGFVDAGRVFEGEAFRLTTGGLTVGGGVGLFLRWGRTGVLGSTWGWATDGIVWQVNTRWAY